MSNATALNETGKQDLLDGILSVYNRLGVVVDPCTEQKDEAGFPEEKVFSAYGYYLYK